MTIHITDVKSFISEPIFVEFNEAPTFSKTPPCPSSFMWREKQFIIISCLSEWKDFSRHGRMSQNMQAQHAETAEKRGSWGVGKFFFDVATKGGRLFRLYYNRSPKNAFDRSGTWILFAELEIQKN